MSARPRWTPALLLVLAGSCRALGASPFPASIDLSSLNGTDGFVLIVLNGANTYSYCGASVSSAGDVNGDGVDDLIIGAPKASPNGHSYAGASYVVFGEAGVGAGGSLDLSALDGTNGFVINGIDTYDGSGRSVSCAGDVNADGVDDLIIGAPSAGLPGPTGAAYVVFGGGGVGAGGSLDLSSLNGTNGFVINAVNAYDTNGFSVSSAGDVNDDGVDDLIIGAPGAGASYVVFGGVGVGTGGSFELSSLNGANGFVINGIDAGWSVSSAGDVNGDGVADLIIGAPGADPNGQSGAGASYVVFGGVGVGAGGALDLSSLNGTNGFVINGIHAYDASGRSVSSAGDVNGDGVDDLVIGAPFADPNGPTWDGASYVVFGGVGVGASGSFELSSLDGTNGFVINKINAGDQSGHSVSSAGDVNADGIDDLIIGAPRADPNGQFEAGASCVVFGGASVGAGGSLDLSTLNGTNGFVINGANFYDRSGISVCSAGDVNGDGVDDLIIGASFASPNGQSQAGESYVVFGRATSACCLSATICVNALTPSQCASAGGTYSDAIDCASITCPGCPGDLDHDGDTDVFDFAIFAPGFGCSTGP